jgi:hypothetical protein
MRFALVALLLGACSQQESSASASTTASAEATEESGAPAAAQAAGSAPAGTPCPTLTAEAAAARDVTLGSSAGLNGVTFARQGGSSACKIDDGGDVACDMRAPGLVRVSGANNFVAYFDVPQGRDARVSMSHDIARCVLN